MNITIDTTEDYGSAVNQTDDHHYTQIQRRQKGKLKDPNFPEPDSQPPRKTKIIQAIQWFDLPDCYRDCMIEKDNQFQIHMTKVSPSIKSPYHLFPSNPLLYRQNRFLTCYSIGRPG